MTTEELSDHLRLASTDELQLLEHFIRSAVARIERVCAIAMIGQVWTVRAPVSCQMVELGINARIVSLDSLTVIDHAGNETSVSTDDVMLRTEYAPIIEWKQGKMPPPLADRAEVVLTVGYGTLSSAVPDDLRALVLMTASSLYEGRTLADVDAAVQRAFEYLSSPYRAKLPY